MKAFILICWIGSGQGEFITQEFSSQEKCEAAGTMLKNRFSNIFFGQHDYICVEK